MTRQVNNPATGEIIADVPCMGGRETNNAISSAYDAFNCMGLTFSDYFLFWFLFHLCCFHLVQLSFMSIVITIFSNRKNIIIEGKKIRKHGGLDMLLKEKEKKKENKKEKDRLFLKTNS